MKKLSTYLFLLLFSFQTSSWADDIRDFQIEGMSLGDSLLDYASKEFINKELNSKSTFFYRNNEFASISLWDLRKKFKIYDDVGIVIKPSDKDYKIYSIEGTFNFGQNINKCYEKQMQIVSDLKELFGDKVKLNSWSKKNLKKHMILVKYKTFKFDTGDEVHVICHDTRENYPRIEDTLYVAIDLEEFVKFVNK